MKQQKTNVVLSFTEKEFYCGEMCMFECGSAYGCSPLSFLSIAGICSYVKYIHQFFNKKKNDLIKNIKRHSRLSIL